MATTTPNFGWSVPTSSDLVKNGATAIETLGDSIDASLVDLKGGTTGQVLAKASNTDMDFVWAADAGAPTSLGYAAGKNAIINGDYSINQRSFTSTTTDGAYGFDRWLQITSGGTCTYSTQAFTAGTAPVAGYEGTNFARLLTSGQSTGYSILVQKIENARTFANQTVTVSFWAKAGTGTPQVAVNFFRNYGTGGSPSASEYTNTATKVTLSTSWARYTATLAIPTVSGKTFGTTANTSSLGLYLFTSDNVTSGSNSLGVQNATIDFWGVQVEAGSVATAFQTATGTIQGELAACQRYYVRYSSNGDSNFDLIGPFGSAAQTTQIFIPWNTPTMRTAASAVDYANLRLSDNSGGTPAISNLVLIVNSNPTTQWIEVTTTGATAYRPYTLQANNNATAYIGFSAEL